MAATVRTEIANLRTEIANLRGETGGLVGGLRREMREQFYRVIGLIVVTILVPVALRFVAP